jgi:hypothetical protein
VSRSDPDTREEFIRQLRNFDTAAIANLRDESALMPPLADAVNSARYWQPPGDDEYLLDEERTPRGNHRPATSGSPGFRRREAG